MLFNRYNKNSEQISGISTEPSQNKKNNSKKVNDKIINPRAKPPLQITTTQPNTNVIFLFLLFNFSLKITQTIPQLRIKIPRKVIKTIRIRLMIKFLHRKQTIERTTIFKVKKFWT